MTEVAVLNTYLIFLKNAKPEHKIALYISILLVLFITASAIKSYNLQLPNTETTPTNFTVLTKHSTAQKKEQYVTLYGYSESNRKIIITAETESTVSEILATESTLLKKGDIIATLNLEHRKKQLKHAKALVKQRKLEYKVSKQLSTQKLESKTKLAHNYTQLIESQALLSKIQQDIDYTVITSPFDGTLERLHIEIGDRTKSRDTAIATIIDNTPLLAVGYLPEQYINHIHLNTPSKVILEDGTSIDGTIRYISKVADPDTHTFRTEIQIQNPNNHYPEGLSVEIIIPYRTVTSHYLPSSLLVINEKGQLGVHGIQSLNKVHIVTFTPVTIIDEDQNGVWLTGLPGQLKVITRGTGFISKGDHVQIEETIKKG